MKKQNKSISTRHYSAIVGKSSTAGITLIALVITIIILLILAGITINLTIGQRGILNRAQEAGRNYQEAAKREDEELANFLKEADDIIDGITPKEPEISEEVKGLKAGDYIKYDTGVEGIGVITCRVLYPVDSEYGLQIISDKNVGENINLAGSDWETGKASYNGAIETLNNEAEKYVNEEYAYDGRCVGSIPTVQNGVFIYKNKGAETTVSIPDTFTRPTGWVNDDTGCYDTDTNYMTDQTALESANIWNTGKKNYWLASCYVDSNSSNVHFKTRYVDPDGTLTSVAVCYVDSSGFASGWLGTCGLRPCISLKSNIIKITGGDGLTEDTAYTIGK